MKKIKIFLASSVTDLDPDRVLVGDFIRRLNDIYFDRGVHFSLIQWEEGAKWEACGPANGPDGEARTSRLDEEIRDSALCFFLFFKQVGDRTRHEFEVALEAFRRTEKPKIVTYFKYVNSPDEATGDVKAFMQMLDGEIKHYYNIYQNIDTLKLGIIMQIKLMGLDTEEPAVEGGKVVFGGIPVADTENLPLFAGNGALASLTAQVKSLSEKLCALREKRLASPDDEALFEAFQQAAKAKMGAEKALHEAEKAVLAASKDLFETTSKGGLSLRQTEAYRALERGDYATALEILDLGAIMADLRHDEAMAEGFTDRIRVDTNELLQRAEVLRMGGIDGAEAEEIAQIYKTVCAAAEKYDLDKQPFYDYAAFLFLRMAFPEALAAAKKLEWYYSDPSQSVPACKKAELYALIGQIETVLFHSKEAEAMLRKALQIFEDLSKAGPLSYETDIAATCMSLSSICISTQRSEEAERLLVRTFEIYKRQTASRPEAYEALLAGCCAALAAVYQTTWRFKAAEQAYNAAAGLLSNVVRRTPEQAPALAVVFSDLGTLYYEEHAFKQAEETLLKAADIYERFAGHDPAEYEAMLARCEALLGQVCGHMGQNVRAEDYCLRAEKVLKRYAETNFDTFGVYLGMCYDALGTLCAETAPARAETYFLSAKGLYERLFERSPETFAPVLAELCSALGGFYHGEGRGDLAWENAQRALTLYKQLYEKEPQTFARGLVDTYKTLIDICRCGGEDGDALDLCLEEEGYFRGMAKETADPLRPDMAFLYSCMGTLYGDLEEPDLSQQAFETSLSLYRGLARDEETTLFFIRTLYTYAAICALRGLEEEREDLLAGAEQAFCEAVEVAEKNSDGSAEGDGIAAGLLATLANFYSQTDREEDAAAANEKFARYAARHAGDETFSELLQALAEDFDE